MVYDFTKIVRACTVQENNVLSVLIVLYCMEDARTISKFYVEFVPYQSHWTENICNVSFQRMSQISRVTAELNDLFPREQTTSLSGGNSTLSTGTVQLLSIF